MHNDDNDDDQPSALKIGDLARRAGLTVRALHHYDSIGLLTPSARDSAGYRLYNRADIARLQQVQALRRFGLSLAEISAALADPAPPLADIVARQITALERQIEQATALRGQLSQLHAQLANGDADGPALADWLATLELMALYDKYFSKDELRQMPFSKPDAQRQRDWPDLVAAIRALMRQGVPADSAEAQLLSQRWMRLLERDTAANPDLALRMTAMLEGEPAAQEYSGITPQLKQYMVDAFAAWKLTLYAKYLDAGELRHLRENMGRHGREWMELIVAVHRLMASGAAPGAPAAQALTRQWFKLFRARIGDDPATLDKIRVAHEREPALMTGTWVSADMLAFIRAAAVKA